MDSIIVKNKVLKAVGIVPKKPVWNKEVSPKTPSVFVSSSIKNSKNSPCSRLENSTQIPFHRYLIQLWLVFALFFIK
jgi:hypothetical protein